MAGSTWLDIVIVLALIGVEGLFVAAEIALVSLHEGQVRTLAESGRRGATLARLVRDPNRFLAAVQIGVTTASLLSSAFGAVTLSDEASDWLVSHGWAKGLADVAGIVGITLIISFVTLVLGELVPKRLALQRAEAAALFFGGPLHRIASIFRPVIWLLSVSTNGVVRLLGGDPAAGREAISEEELRSLVAAHQSLSVDERRLIDEVFAAGEHSISEVMVPRTEVTFLDGNLTISRALKGIAESPHQRYPVIGRDYDEVLGYVNIRELLFGDARTDRDRTVGSLAHEIKAMPGTKNVLAALSEMRREGHHIAIVVDEYGGTDGIVTLEDLVEEIVGDVQDAGRGAEAGMHHSGDGAVELDGKANLDDVVEASGLHLPEGPYATLGGYVMAVLGRLPVAGDRVACDGYEMEVTGVDGRRVARVRIAPPAREPGEADAELQPVHAPSAH